MIDSDNKNFKDKEPFWVALVFIFVTMLTFIFAFIGGATVISAIFRIPYYIGFMLTFFFYFCSYIFFSRYF